jgi:hypothetical protein
MAKKYRKQKHIGESEAEAAILAFEAEAKKAVGSDGEPGRFKGFVLADGLKALVRGALDLFVVGDFMEVTKKIKEAEVWLDRAQRKYCLGAVEKYFAPMIGELFGSGELDSDLVDRIMKREREFKEIALIVTSVSLDQASRCYWALEDTIHGVREEQARRVANRTKREAEAKRQREAEEAERSRQRQRELDADRRQARADRVRGLKEGLMAMM